MDVLLGLILLGVLLAVPFYRILGKAGLSPMLALLLFLPLFGYLIILGILAFAEWPNEPAGYR
jgi:hypothetical protein